MIPLKPVLAISAVALLTACNSSSHHNKDLVKLDRLFDEDTKDFAGTGEPITSPEGDIQTVSWGGEESVSPAVSVPGQLSMWFDKKRRVERIDIAEINGTLNDLVTFDRKDGDKITHDGDYIRARERDGGDEMARIANPEKFGFNYQTYGVWVTGMGSSSGTAGVGTFGTSLDTTTVPTSGSAEYRGGSTGFYDDGVGNRYLTTANLEATANFTATPTVTFETTGTTGRNLDTDTRHSFSNLDLNGELGVTGNTFSGTVTAREQTPDMLRGSATGRFYGTEAREMGGTFDVRNEGNSAYIGSFGGRTGGITPTPG